MSPTKRTGKPVVKRHRRTKVSCQPFHDCVPPACARRLILALGERREPLIELAREFGVSRARLLAWSRNPLFRSSLQVALRDSSLRRVREVEVFRFALRTRPLRRVCGRGEAWLDDPDIEMEFRDESDPWHSFPHMPPDLPGLPEREFVE